MWAEGPDDGGRLATTRLGMLLCTDVFAASWMILIVAAQAPSPAVVGVEGELAAPLREGLLEELGPERVTTASVADLWCRLERRAEGITLSVDRGADLAPVERTIAVVDDDETAAVRVAVLLVARMAVQRPAAVTPLAAEEPEPGSRPRRSTITRAPPTPIEAPSPWRMDVSLGVASMLWARPITPRVGPTLSLRAGYGAWRAGVSAQLLGLVCCATSDEVRIEATSFVAGVDGGYAFLESNRWTMTALASVGARRIGGTARSLVFADTGTTEDLTVVHTLVGAAVEAELRVVDPVWVVLGGGVNASFGARTIVLPQAFAQASDAVTFGRFTPWATLRVRVRAF